MSVSSEIYDSVLKLLDVYQKQLLFYICQIVANIIFVQFASYSLQS